MDYLRSDFLTLCGLLAAEVFFLHIIILFTMKKAIKQLYRSAIVYNNLLRLFILDFKFIGIVFDIILIINIFRIEVRNVIAYAFSNHKFVQKKLLH